MLDNVYMSSREFVTLSEEKALPEVGDVVVFKYHDNLIEAVGIVEELNEEFLIAKVAVETGANMIRSRPIPAERLTKIG